MQTENSHPDTYAATAHRMFFKNLMAGKPPQECPDNDGHNVDAIDALTITVPVILKYSDATAEERNKKVMEAIRVLRNVKTVERFAIAFSDILVKVLHGGDLQNSTNEVAQKLGMRDLGDLVSKQSGDPMVACYIESSFPALLFMVYKYASSVEGAVLANANAGGENVARGSLLGALLGAAHWIGGFPAWAVDGLEDREAIVKEIKEFIKE